MSLRRLLGLSCLVLGLASLLMALPSESARAAGKAHASTSSKASGHRSHHHFRGCRLQRPQLFLERRHFVKHDQLLQGPFKRALAYRVKHYGSVPGIPLGSLNPMTAISQAETTTFMGLPIRVHKKIVPALRCVEWRIHKTCRSSRSRYTPHAIGGFRTQNTYHHGEVSNHLFGIAIDIDPHKNPCCHCVKPWPDNPICKKDAKSIYDKTSLPRCWVHAFERYGFYWLGRDELQDTMHFEFLGDPDRIEP